MKWSETSPKNPWYSLKLLKLLGNQFETPWNSMELQEIHETLWDSLKSTETHLARYEIPWDSFRFSWNALESPENLILVGISERIQGQISKEVPRMLSMVILAKNWLSQSWTIHSVVFCFALGFSSFNGHFSRRNLLKNIRIFWKKKSEEIPAKFSWTFSLKKFWSNPCKITKVIPG